jgi:predicted phage replisome organizer
MKIKWIKISTDMFDDEKIAIISSMPEANAMLVIWIRLLALAGKTNDGGSIYFDEGIPYTDDMLSTIFRQPLNIVRLALTTFEKFKMIERREDQIYICNWEKHQNIEGMEKIRLLAAERVRKHRERKRLEVCNATVTNCNALDKIRIDKKERDIPKNPKTKFGEHGLVLLTAEENEKLRAKLGDALPAYVSRLEKYVGQTGKSYKSHYFTILNWYGKDYESTTTTNVKPNRFVV